jgi:hypothetical protein
MRRAPFIVRLIAFLFGAALVAAPIPVLAFSRVKDLVEIEGIRDNMLVGYGLVVGLNGTGDSLRNAPFTQESIETMLERLGVNTHGQTMQTKNVAAVMVTANLPAFAGAGSLIDISVSAMGDAKNLQGGTKNEGDETDIKRRVAHELGFCLFCRKQPCQFRAGGGSEILQHNQYVASRSEPCSECLWQFLPGLFGPVTGSFQRKTGLGEIAVCEGARPMLQD